MLNYSISSMLLILSDLDSSVILGIITLNTLYSLKDDCHSNTITIFHSLVNSFSRMAPQHLQYRLYSTP